MPNLSIKDVPEAWAEILRQRAIRNHRSLQGELMAMVERAANEYRPAALFQSNPSKPHFGERITVSDLLVKSIARQPQPLATGPMSADIVRSERDER